MSLVRTTGMPGRAGGDLVVAHRDEPPGDAAVAPHPHHEDRDDRARPGRTRRRPAPRSVPVRTARAGRSTWTAGSGRPEQIVLCSNGMVQHDVASTDVCMNSANPSVLTARYRPRMRRAVSPTSTETTAGGHPGEGQQQDEGDASSQVGGDVGAHRHQPELPQRDLARPAGEHGQRQGDDAVDADLGHEERPTHAQHEGQQRGHDHGRQHTRRCPPVFAGRRRSRRKARVPVVHEVRSAVREPFCSDAARTSRASCSNTKRISSTVADPEDGLVMFHCEQVLDDAHADAGHEGDGQAHHGAEQRGQQRQQEEPGAEDLGQGARLGWARRAWR